MTTHTPGPWELHAEIPGHNSLRICVPDPDRPSGCRTIGEAEILRMPRDVAEANARLMAKAPELLAIARELVAALDETKFDVFIGSPADLLRLTDLYMTASKVIAQVEGGLPV